MIKFDANMNEKYSNTYFGILVVKYLGGTANSKEKFQKIILEELSELHRIHSNYNRKHIIETHQVFKPYVDYYKKFKKTYHVLLQLESTINRKELPNATPLVQAMFLTELKTSLLIAGHDIEKCKMPLTIHMSQGGEIYKGFGNREISVKPNDICLCDQENIILSIIYGQDEKTRITEDTSDVLFLIDGVPGLDKIYVEDGLKTLLNYLRILDPNIDIIGMEVISYI